MDWDLPCKTAAHSLERGSATAANIFPEKAQF
jgi:hypothetical protein